MTLEDILAQVDGAETKQRADHLRALAEDHGDLAWLIEWATEHVTHPPTWHCPHGQTTKACVWCNTEGEAKT